MYRVFVGVNSPSGEKNYEWDIEDDEGLIVIASFIQSEKDATGFVISITRKKGD